MQYALSYGLGADRVEFWYDACAHLSLCYGELCQQALEVLKLLAVSRVHRCPPRIRRACCPFRDTRSTTCHDRDAVAPLRCTRDIRVSPGRHTVRTARMGPIPLCRASRHRALMFSLLLLSLSSGPDRRRLARARNRARSPTQTTCGPTPTPARKARSSAWSRVERSCPSTSARRQPSRAAHYGGQ